MIYWLEDKPTDIGEVMLPPASPITSLEGLDAVRLEVAGVSADKGWRLLQTLYSNASGGDLAASAIIKFGAQSQLLEG